MALVTGSLEKNDKFNENYSQLSKILSKCKVSLGFIGGYEKKGMYFIGSKNGKLIYLDPHYAQEEINIDNL